MLDGGVELTQYKGTYQIGGGGMLLPLVNIGQ